MAWRDLASFVQHAANDTIVIVMIESLEGLEQLDEILKVEGIDIILEGAADLSQSMGMPWQSSHPKVKEKVQRCMLRLKIVKSISVLFHDNLKILQRGNNNPFSFCTR